MQMSILKRLIAGYLIIFLLLMTTSIYTIMRFEDFDAITRSILTVDNAMNDYEKKLSDTLLSQILYERKYLIIKDDALYDQFLLARGDFGQYLDRMQSIADTPEKNEILKKIRENHDLYQSVFFEEVEFVRRNKRYAQNWYKDEKDHAVDGIMDQLKELRVRSQQSTYEKIRLLGEAGVSSKQMAISIAIIALLVGLLISLFITRSITKPLSIMITKTREIADGNLQADVQLTSPPEIGKLARAFNDMCEKLRQIDKLKSDFFSTMSHELRTPLTSIKEGTSLLIEGIGGDLTEKQKKLLTIISAESNRLIGLVNSLLDLSKMEAGMMVYSFMPTDIKTLVGKAIVAVEPLTMSKNVAITISAPSDIPLLSLDGERIIQAVRNLVGNAVKFAPNGGKVDISLQYRDQNLEITVSDNGPGVSKEYLQTIFEKFQQAPSSGPYQVKGTGLGLAIVKHIVTAHKGKVWAESEPGKGSSFFILLPAKPVTLELHEHGSPQKVDK